MRSTFLLPIIFSLFSSCSTGQVINTGSAGNSGHASTVNKETILRLVNDVRSKGCKCGETWYNKVPPVSWNKQLETAAVNHSKDMNQNNYLSHIAPDGSNGGDRMISAGYKWKSYGENIAAGHATEEKVIQSWLLSPGHCKNIMGSGFKEIGVGRAGNYWTLAIATK